MTTLEEAMGDHRVNPDAQATVSDFLDYTEYLPSDLTRSLTLVGKLDATYISSAHNVHELLKTYSDVSNISLKQRSGPQTLRQQISSSLDHAIKSRESSFAEAERLYEVVDRHYSRLTSIIAKLKALPKPPSRDPTPVPSKSPEAIRSRNIIAAPYPSQSIVRPDKSHGGGLYSQGLPSDVRSRHKSHKVTTPGQVFPPPNPDVLTNVDTESEFDPPSPGPLSNPRTDGPPRNRPLASEKHKPLKPFKTITLKAPKPPKAPRPPKAPGTMGTNVHSAVAGISTSNALALLAPPPVDSKPGSEHAPWMRLTEWEMAKLRKKMKKNAIWSPSETMIRRELAAANRGPEKYRAARDRSLKTGEDFVDAENLAMRPKGRPLVPGEISSDALGSDVMALSNRGMKLNEAKKLKREQTVREQAALAAAEAEAATPRPSKIRRRGETTSLGDISNTFNDLFSRPREELAQSSAAAAKQLIGVLRAPAKDLPNFPYKKRRHESSPKVNAKLFPSDVQSPGPKGQAMPSSPAKPSSPKKRKVDVVSPLSPKSHPVFTTTTKVPLAAPALSPVKDNPSIAPRSSSAAMQDQLRQTAAASRPRRSSPPSKIVVPSSGHPARAPSSPHEPTSARSSLPSRRASANPSTSAGQNREHLRRKSATPAPPPPPTPVVTAAGRRSKRPAPGAITVSKDDGGPAMIIGTRKNAPRKKSIGAGTGTAKKTSENKENLSKAQEEVAGEEIDPDEDRYCICNDVSWGEMIECDNDEVGILRYMRRREVLANIWGSSVS